MRDVTCPDCGEEHNILGEVRFVGTWEVGPDGVGDTDAVSYSHISEMATWTCGCGYSWRAKKPT